jgi:hypothetical protein
MLASYITFLVSEYLCVYFMHSSVCLIGENISPDFFYEYLD